MFIIYSWKSNIWYNKPKIIKSLKLHSDFLIVSFVLYKQLKMAFFKKTTRVSAASCCAVQRLSTEVVWI